MKKINVSLDDELVERLDAYSKSNYLSRSGVVTVSLSRFLDAEEMTKAVIDLSRSFRRIADTGEVDQATLQQLEEFERFVSFLPQSK